MNQYFVFNTIGQNINLRCDFDYNLVASLGSVSGVPVAADALLYTSTISTLNVLVNR